MSLEGIILPMLIVSIRYLAFLFYVIYIFHGKNKIMLEICILKYYEKIAVFMNSQSKIILPVSESRYASR